MLLRQPWFWIYCMSVSLGVMVAVGHAGPKQPRSSRVQIGLASWYGPGFHGRKTASGERLSRQRLTAAHRSLPFGTKVLVTNLKTQAQVEVKITDRGPRQKRRLIDLSYAAAHRLGLLEQGLERVQVVVSEPALTPSVTEGEVFHVVQLRAFAQREAAQALHRQVQVQHPKSYVAARRGPLGTYYRVRVGPFPTEQQSQRTAEALTRAGHYVFVDRVMKSASEAQGPR